MLNCLIIDDSPINRTIASYILNEMGITSQEVDNAQGALTFITEGAIDFVMLDWMMPDIDGIEFLELIRESKEGKKVKIVMCTAKDGEANKQAAMAAGADAFITKPITVASIEAALESIGLKR